MRNVWKRWTGMVLAGAMLAQTGGVAVFAAGADGGSGDGRDYVPPEQIRSVTADNYQEGYEPEKAVDGIEDDPGNCWHTQWEEGSPGFPHWIQVEFTEPLILDSLVYVARSATGFQFVTDYEIWASEDGTEEGLEKIDEGTWSRAKTAEAEFPPVTASMIRFITLDKEDSNYEDTWSVSASEIKFGLAPTDIGAYEEEIADMQAKLDRVHAHAAADSGEDAHQYPQAALDYVAEQKENLQKILENGDVSGAHAALEAAQAAIDKLLDSNREESEALMVQIPPAALEATANTENSGYEAEKAVDGDTSTIWHTQWEPESAERPHELTVDLGQSVLLGEIAVIPRQDMGSGRITEGELYVGNSLDSMEKAASFQMTDTAVIPVDCREVRYIRLRSLAGTDENTAIAEVQVSTYDRGYVKLWEAYSEAAYALGNAQAGEEIGQYSEEVKNHFENQLAEFAAQLETPHLNSVCYDIAGEISRARAEFLDQVNRYTMEDLQAMIAEAETLADELSGKDQELLKESIESARTVAENPDSTVGEIHEAVAALKATMEGVKIAGEDRYDLSGRWEFELGAYASDAELTDTVNLPGTLDENKKGTPNSFRDPKRLSRYYTYTGPAAYQRQIFIPYGWEDKEISLYMERSRETRVWVNGEEILAPDSSNLMAVAQEYDLTDQIRFGALNEIAIEVDNSYPNSPYAAITTSSMATEETQTNWNGIVGTFELRAGEKLNIEDLRVYPNADLKTATVQVDVENKTEEAYRGTVTVQAEGLEPREIPVEVEAGATAGVSIGDYSMGENVKLWGEFEQNLYTMKASLENGSEMSESFGMRDFDVDDETKQLVNNGDKVFLREEANCAVFPLTAYAPMDEAGWEKLFTTYQSYGINAVRFHSWCPPDAAFRVADRLGLYLQPELSSWDAGSMFGGEAEKDYYSREAKAIVKEYANHPSFVMLTFGNELHFASGGYEYADQLIQELKVQDSTRLYSFASNSDYGGTKPTANSDFFTGQVYNGTSMRGIYSGMSGFINQSYPSSTVNYEEAVNRAAEESGVPAFSFEVGQFQVFPDVLTELDDYTGVLEPRNLQLVAERLDALEISDEEVAEYINASGMLSRLGYRMEIEAALRTRNMSGISLLGIQDFSGQSTALVGMMNALGDPKPYQFADPEAFSTFFSPEVALMETEKFSWTNAENFTGNLLLANYGPENLEGEMTWSLADGETVLDEGSLPYAVFAQGDVTEAGTITIPLSDIEEAKQLKLTIALGEVENDYDLWVYPANETAPEGDVYVTEYLDEEALYILEDGGKVLLSPKVNKSTLPDSITGTFTTAFWSSQFVSESQPGSMGLLIDPEHPVFDGFPTEYHSNYQWWAMAKLGRPMVLENLTQEDGTKIEPLVQVLDSFSTVRTMGLLYEAKVGEGKLMVSSMGLEQLKGQYPEANALRNSILNYMNSEEFDPQFEVSVEEIQESVVGTEEDPRINLAEKSSGGEMILGENTHTCQEGYDNNPQDRTMELNDGRIDVDVPSRSWTDWNAYGNYPDDAEITAVLKQRYIVDTVVLPFFEDQGCKAPAEVRVEYRAEDGTFRPVENPSQTTGFIKGNNTITFDGVETDQIRIIMKHQAGMGVALSEFIVYEKRIPAEAIEIVTENQKTSIRVDETMQLGIEYMPENANVVDVRWKAIDAEGNKSEIAKVSLSGVLTPSAAGTVYVQASLRSDPEVVDTMEITILPAAETDLPYVDVYPHDYFYDAAESLYEKGIMTGMDETHFGPTVKLARAQFVTVLYRMAGSPEVSGKADFADVPGNAWFADAVAWAVENGVVTGYSNGNFGPSDLVTREQIAAMLYRYDGNAEVPDGAELPGYPDAGQISDFAREAMIWAVENGIITGQNYGTILAPQDTAYRAEAAVMIDRYLE